MLDVDATLPSFSPVVVVGAGVHGLSTALHLADPGRRRGIVVLDEQRVGAEASGISGGIVRNLYVSAAMNEIVRRSWTCSSYGAHTCFTLDSYPIVDFVRENAYPVLDSNHGFKMLALGKLAAAEILGRWQPELDPFRLSRFAVGALHPASASPYPWT